MDNTKRLSVNNKNKDMMTNPMALCQDGLGYSAKANSSFISHSLHVQSGQLGFISTLSLLQDPDKRDATNVKF